MDVTALVLPEGFHTRNFAEPPAAHPLDVDLTVYDHRCIHMVRGAACDAPSLEGHPHGWLCNQHDGYVSPKARLGTISLTVEEQICFESARLRGFVRKHGRIVTRALEPELQAALHPVVTIH